MGDKFITAVSRTADGIEWTTLRGRRGKFTRVAQSSMPIETPEDAGEESLAAANLPDGLAAVNLPDGLAEKLKGNVIVSLPSSQMLMRVMEFPTTDPKELKEMVGFQIDKISPFPLDQLAVSHEILADPEETSFTLMAAALRSSIDSIGSTFNERGVRIHSIDGRTLGWIRLLIDQKHIAAKECEIIIIDDGFDFALVITNNGIPVAIRMLHQNMDSNNLADELSYEIEYTLMALDAERGVDMPSCIQFWSYGYVAPDVYPKLEKKCGLIVMPHDLGDLPPLSEGIVMRGISQNSNRIELIPQEWIEHVERQRLKKQFATAASIILSTWLVVVLALMGTYQYRKMQLNKVMQVAASIAPQAQEAKNNREKMKRLKIYTDRSRSALECLREVTRTLPPGDIVFSSYNYKNGDGVTLRGDSADDAIVTDYMNTLTESELFEELKNQSLSAQVRRGVRRWIYSATLVLPASEIEDAE